MLELTKATMREMREIRAVFRTFFPVFSLPPSASSPPCLLDFHWLPAVAMHHQISRALFQPESFHRRCTLFIYIEDIRTMTTARTETIVVPPYRLCAGEVCFASNLFFSFFLFLFFIYLFACYNSNNFSPRNFKFFPVPSIDPTMSLYEILSCVRLFLFFLFFSFFLISILRFVQCLYPPRFKELPSSLKRGRRKKNRRSPP